MGNHREKIDNLVIKLSVLESKIQKLELQADEVIQDVETEFRQQMKELHQKRDAALQKLSEIMQAENLE